jgi:hypothetical protein
MSMIMMWSNIAFHLVTNPFIHLFFSNKSGVTQLPARRRRKYRRYTWAAAAVEIEPTATADKASMGTGTDATLTFSSSIIPLGVVVGVEAPDIQGIHGIVEHVHVD